MISLTLDRDNRTQHWLLRRALLYDSRASRDGFAKVRTVEKSIFMTGLLFMLKYTVLLQQYCCNSTVAIVLLQQYCCNSTVATILLQKHVTTVLLQQYCCNSAIATVLLQQCCCNSTVATGSEEHTSELQSHHDLVCRLLLEKKRENHDA